jgi:hypothetical protein
MADNKAETEPYGFASMESSMPLLLLPQNTPRHLSDLC